MHPKRDRASRSVVWAVLPVLLLWAGGCPMPDGLTCGATDDTRPVLKDGVAGFDIATAMTEAYWYSRYDLGSLVMKSGLGDTFMPDMTMVGAMVDMVSDDESSATPPTNAALLKRVFNAGNPEWINPGDSNPMDFADERWAPASDTGTSAAASGWTMIKELEWVKQFEVDNHFGVPGGDDGIPGAQQRFAGLVLYVEAVMQAAEWINNPSVFDTSDLGGMYVMLEAMSDLAELTAATSRPRTAVNRARMVAGMLAPSMGMTDADELSGWFLAEADRLFDTLETPTDLEDLSLAIQALTWYAATSSTNRSAAKARIAEFADVLAAMRKDGPIDHARAIRGLLEAVRVTGDAAYLTAASDSFDALLDDFDWAYGVFASRSTYTADEVASVYGAMISTRLNGDPERGDDATDLAEHFFEAVVNMSGLQISAPPSESIAEYERLADIFLRYPTTPVPPAAGGEHGIAPVFAGSVTWNPASKTWAANRSLYDTAGSMHLSSEMLWSFAEVDGFPDVPADGTEPPPDETEPPPVDMVSFSGQIQPIFDANCTICHVSDGFADEIMHLNAEESFDALVDQPSVQNPDLTRVVPGDSGASLLFLKVSSDSPPVGVRMPFGGAPLPAGEIALIRDWIDQGAQNN